jgi:cytochrome c oxidase subunit 2
VARRFALLTVVLVSLAAAPSCRFGAGQGVTDQGQKISSLYVLLFWIAIPVAVIVYGLMLWSIVRYRRRNDDLPKQTRSNLPIEVAYTVIPIFMVIGIFIATFRTERTVDRVVSNPTVVVNATAFQWQWRFQFPASNLSVVGLPNRPPIIELPVGETIRVNVASADVVHSLFVPAFLFKRDAIPGVVNHFDWTIPASAAGQTFRGECAAFCGLNHAQMTFFIKAVTPEEFQSWLTQQPGATP